MKTLREMQQSPSLQKTPLKTEKRSSLEYPYLTKDLVIKKARQRKPIDESKFRYYPETIIVSSDSETSTKKKKSSEKKGGCIETEFIPYNENVAYEFYDDPNELCDRLRLLIASKTAGNTNHMQEINSLIAELRESGYIY